MANVSRSQTQFSEKPNCSLDPIPYNGFSLNVKKDSLSVPTQFSNAFKSDINISGDMKMCQIKTTRKRRSSEAIDDINNNNNRTTDSPKKFPRASTEDSNFVTISPNDIEISSKPATGDGSAMDEADSLSGWGTGEWETGKHGRSYIRVEIPKMERMRVAHMGDFYDDAEIGEDDEIDDDDEYCYNEWTEG